MLPVNVYSRKKLDSIYGTLQGGGQILHFWYGKNRTSAQYKAQLEDPYVARSILDFQWSFGTLYSLGHNPGWSNKRTHSKSTQKIIKIKYIEWINLEMDRWRKMWQMWIVLKIGFVVVSLSIFADCASMQT